jgi:flagellar export protein FliJ
MKRFDYPLERLLRLKRQEKQMAEFDQLEARGRLDQALTQLAAWEQKLSAATVAIAQRLGALVPANEYLGRHDLVQAIQREIVDARQQVAGAERAWQQANERFSQLAVQVETLQTHRSGHWDEYQHSQQLAEQNQRDELALRKWSAEGGEG